MSEDFSLVLSVLAVIAILSAVALVTETKPHRLADQTVCSMEHEAYQATPANGAALYLHRAPSADPLCQTNGRKS